MPARRALALIALLAAQPASAGVTVSIAPARDVSPLEFRSAGEREALMRELARVLTRLGETALPKGREATIDLLDVRPAGRFEPWRAGASGPRVLTEVTPPSVRLRYRLSERGRVLASGEETVTDLNYLWDASARSSPSSFPYERELVRDWFRDRIVRLRPR